MASVKDFVRELLGKPHELAELRDALQAVPAVAPPARPEMDPEQYAALAREQKARITAFGTSRERLTAETEAAEAAARKAGEAVDRSRAQFDRLVLDFTQSRDEVAKRLLDGCPAVVKARAEQCRREAAGLTTESFFLPVEVGGGHIWGGPSTVGEIANDSIGAAMAALPRNVSNSESVSARRKALYALAELILDWAWQGAFGTVEEFERLFKGAYASLPKVEPLRDVLKRDIRGRHFVNSLRRPALPPAA